MLQLKGDMIKQIIKTNARRILLGLTGLVLAVSSVVSFTNIDTTLAQSIQDQINSLQNENAKYKNEISRLEDQAVSYEDAIAKLQAEITALQQRIDQNAKERQRLASEIKEAEEELAKQKKILGQNIKAMYLEGNISTLEMVASSKDLSDYIDKAQYRNSVKDKIKGTLDKVAILRAELVRKEEGVAKLLKEQEAQKSQLAANQQKQHNMLSYNQSQRAEFNEKTKNNQSKIDALIAEQRRANFNPDGGYYFLRFPGSVKGFSPTAYPYANAGFSMQLGACSNNDSWPDSPDDWGYCTRQCVSYAAWAVEASGRSAPRNYGNARDWVEAAYARGIPVYRTPQAGDVAISTAGNWGHAMYVESVSGGSFTTSEYNTYLTGQLSYQTRNY
ncbi:MAG: CHAP domain-containing protein [Candidatus Saccharimonadales bacterium]